MMKLQDKISLIEKVNISNNKPEDKIFNNSDQNIKITKKSVSPYGRKRAYKNRYNSPEINRLKQNDKNKVLLDIKHFKNKNSIITNKREEMLNDRFDYLPNSINTLNSQNISKRILLKEKMFDINETDDNNIRLTDHILEKDKINYLKNLYKDENIINFGGKNIHNNFNDEKIIQRSKSSNEYNLGNKRYIDTYNEFKKIQKRNYELININFPGENIIKSNSVKILPGKFGVLNSNRYNKNLLMNNSDKQIINHENIIINNGFVNMNNNYFVNNNNLNDDINKIDNNNNNNYSKNDFLNNNVNDIKFNNDLNYKNEIVINTNNYYDSQMNVLESIKKQSNYLIKMNYNKSNHYNNSNKVYVNPKFLTKLNEQPEYYFNSNYNNDFNLINSSKDIDEEEKYNNDSKEGNFNLQEENIESESSYINNTANTFLENNCPQISKFNKRLLNNFSRNENNLKQIPNPQYFHPTFHPNIPFQYISILQIQYPIQMMIKKSHKSQFIKNKLINFYPPKIQLEIRPCCIFQPLLPKKRKNLHKKIPKNKRLTHNKIKHKRPVFKIPPCKKASLSQGKSLNFIHKYYDENFILEEENEEENKALKNIVLTDRKNEVNIEENKNSDDINIRPKEKVKNDAKEEKLNKVNIATNNEIKEINKKEEKEKNKIVNKINDDKKISKSLNLNKMNKNEEKKIITKQRYINRMKIPIKNDNIYKKNKTDKIILFNIKKKKQSPIKEIMVNKKNINTIFSLNEVRQRFNILNNSTRINSTSISIEKSRDNTLNNISKSKSKITNKKNDNKVKNIKIINYIPSRKIMQKSNSFFSKKIFEKIHSKHSDNILNNSYKNLSRKKISEKNIVNLTQKNRVIKIDLSKL